MNLTTDAWIPIVCSDGKPGIVSLREAFERGEEISDLAVRAHERIGNVVDSHFHLVIYSRRTDNSGNSGR